MEQRQCAFDGCKNLGKYKHINSKGEIARKKYCDKHPEKPNREIKRRGRKGSVWYRFKRDNCTKCEYCGWEGPCIPHRPMQKEPYSEDNIRSICRNCHYMIHHQNAPDPYALDI